MNDVLIAGEPLELIQEAFRGMKAQRRRDGWVSITGRLDPVPGEALMRALQRTEAELPRRIDTTREQHRAAALDEIARQFTVAAGRAPGDTTANAQLMREARAVSRVDEAVRVEPVERAKKAIDLAFERFGKREPGARHLTSVSTRT
jgi:hypothetical protein